MVYGFSLANVEILITRCLWGESAAATSGGVRKNDLMETMSHIKLEFSFPFARKKKKKR